MCLEGPNKYINPLESKFMQLIMHYILSSMRVSILTDVKYYFVGKKKKVVDTDGHFFQCIVIIFIIMIIIF